MEVDEAGAVPHRTVSSRSKLTIGRADLDKLSIIEAVPPEKRVVVQLDNVSATVPDFFGSSGGWRDRLAKLKVWKKKQGQESDAEAPPETAGGQPARRQILFGISARIVPGEVLALMGPSGSGKTSLLSVLGRRAQSSMQVTGSVTFNGRPMVKRLKRQVGYVLQDDLLYESLTVEETLTYAATLRLPRGVTAAQRAQRVNDVIAGLSLEGCRDTIVGGFMRKGISGGERKRTSVGHELLINPSILFLDEPTSGLDSTTAMHLLLMLHHLAQGGRTIVTTIHQPSSRIYQTLDRLLLLSQGHCLYLGVADDAIAWFGALGYSLPYGMSTADFILDLASADVSSKKRSGEESRRFLVDCSEAFLARYPMEGYRAAEPGADEWLAEVCEAQSVDGVGNGSHSNGAANGLNGKHAVQLTAVKTTADGTAANTNGVAAASENGISAPLETLSPDGGGGNSGHRRVDDRWGANYATQIRVLFQRSIRTRRFDSFSFNDILMMISIAVLAGLFWLQMAQDSTLVAARNTMGLLFFELLFLSFHAMFSALFTFPQEQRMMLKERASGMYRLSAFYIARLASDWPMDFTLPTLFVTIIYFMGGLRYSAAAFFGNLFAVFLGMLVAQSIGLLLGILFMDPKTAQVYATIISMTMVLTGGFFVVDLPDWIGWLRYLSFVYYTLGILLYVEFNGRTIYSCVSPGVGNACELTNPSNPAQRAECEPVSNLQQSLQLLQTTDNQGRAIRDGMILVGVLIVMRVWCYYALRKKTLTV